MGGRRHRHRDTGAMGRARPQLEQLTEEMFAFLVTNQGFAHGPMERDNWTTTYYFTRGPLGLGVTLDFRDEAVDLSLVRLQDNGRPPPNGGYGFTASGERQRLNIPLYLRDRAGVRDEALDALFAAYRAQPPDQVNTSRVLQAMREVVARHLALLDQPVEILFPMRGVDDSRT
ncbi:MAG TPA: hypothetical protein VFU63_08125 [Ktedonobacterales bacterium]|nr:hypothetical protein [Ktedonobacterales bacterium]